MVGDVWKRESYSTMGNDGYERVEQVETRGQFAIRGGIIDIYPMTGEYAYRLELWMKKWILYVL